MHWLSLSEKTRILLCHRYFDFSQRRWENELQRGKRNPFEESSLARARPNITIPQWPTALGSLPDNAIAYFEPEYPQALQEMKSQSPPVIYLRVNRNIPPPDSFVAIVGTRNPSYAGRKNAQVFANATAAAGLGVVSGLARGIDSIAHQNALRPYTIAVVGSGVDKIYPKEHSELAKEIVQKNGTIISIFPDTQIIQPTNFPRRNLIIAALSAGTIVIEGAETSGAHLTGRLTLSVNRRAIALLQDFNTSAGKGAMNLLDAGGDYARDPEDALRIIAATWKNGLQPLAASGGKTVPPPREFTLDEWVDQIGDTPRALRELEARIHNGLVLPVGGGIYRHNA